VVTKPRPWVCTSPGVGQGLHGPIIRNKFRIAKDCHLCSQILSKPTKSTAKLLKICLFSIPLLHLQASALFYLF
jgi:hypothetical protein